jgi:hypothetical protein
MLGKKRILVVFILVVMFLAIPATAFANKRIWTAKLTSGAELHEVVDSSARGSLVMATFPDGTMHFMLSIHGLSGPVTGAHLHGPATTAENAPIIVSLCGAPAPAAVATCDTSADGTLSVSGVIDSNLFAQWGLPGGVLFDYLDNGMVYVNAHTALNPAGETRGQVSPQ